jgi:hypothetical protein
LSIAQILNTLHQIDGKKNKKEKEKIEKIKFRLSLLECANHVNLTNVRVYIQNETRYLSI